MTSFRHACDWLDALPGICFYAAVGFALLGLAIVERRVER